MVLQRTVAGWQELCIQRLYRETRRFLCWLRPKLWKKIIIWMYLHLSFQMRWLHRAGEKSRKPAHTIPQWTRGSSVRCRAFNTWWEHMGSSGHRTSLYTGVPTPFFFTRWRGEAMTFSRSIIGSSVMGFPSFCHWARIMARSRGGYGRYRMVSSGTGVNFLKASSSCLGTTRQSWYMTLSISLISSSVLPRKVR